MAMKQLIGACATSGLFTLCVSVLGLLQVQDLDAVGAFRVPVLVHVEQDGPQLTGEVISGDLSCKPTSVSVWRVEGERGGDDDLLLFRVGLDGDSTRTSWSASLLGVTGPVYAKVVGTSTCLWAVSETVLMR
jgi:hypothetical protein